MLRFYVLPGLKQRHNERDSAQHQPLVFKRPLYLCSSFDIWTLYVNQALILTVNKYTEKVGPEVITNNFLKARTSL
jgi:hypothetical protein